MAEKFIRANCYKKTTNGVVWDDIMSGSIVIVNYTSAI